MVQLCLPDLAGKSRYTRLLVRIQGNALVFCSAVSQLGRLTSRELLQ